jgi:hypothetical protein
MADLLTHFASARLPAAFVRDRSVQALLIAGTFLPDLAGKGLYFVTRSGENFNVPSHSVLGLAVLCFGLSFLLEERLRRPGFAALLGGSYLHVAVDLLKDSNGVGLLGVLHPFTPAGFELGLIDPENVILLLPVDAAILVLAWFLERRLSRVRE